MKISYLQTTIALAISAMLLGCNISDSSSPVSKQLSVKIKTASTSPPAKFKSNTMQAVDSLSEVKLLIDELVLDNGNNENQNNEEGDVANQDSVDFEINDLVVNLPLDGSDLVLSAADVPEGTYNKFEMEVDDADQEGDVQDDDLVEGSEDSLRYSVVIKGIADGQEFTYKSQVEFELEMELNPPVVISETTTTIGIQILVDPSGWFTDPDTGEALDPNNEDHREKIDENIKRSFQVDEENGDNNNNEGEED